MNRATAIEPCSATNVLAESLAALLRMIEEESVLEFCLQREFNV